MSSELIRKIVATRIEADGCPVRAHPQREEIDCAIWLDQLTNNQVARRFGIGDNPHGDGEEHVRQYRSTVTSEELAVVQAGRGRVRDLTLAELRAYRQGQA